MNPNSYLAFASAALSVTLAAGGIIFGRSTPSKFFGAGMVLLAVESVLEGLTLQATSPEGIATWHGWTFVAKSCLPGVWFCFSATYARGDYHAFLRRWKWPLIVGSIVPLLFTLCSRENLFEVQFTSASISECWLRFTSLGKILNGFLLTTTVAILANLERTFRAAIGTARWRLKFLVLGIAVIFAARIYTRSQVLLFSGHDLSLIGLENGALILGCLLITVTYFRNGFVDLDLYPSRAVLQTSLTALLVGGYLVVVGLLAQVASRLGGASSFRFQAFVILLGMVCLALVLLSDKARQKAQHFISQNFRRPQHDFRKIWTRFTEATADARDQMSLCSAAATVLSETFSALSTSLWLVEQNGALVLTASSSGIPAESVSPASHSSVNVIDLQALQRQRRPFDLDAIDEEWVESLRVLASVKFRKGGHRICLPLWGRDECLGVALLADRVNGVTYTAEELDLLECIGGQIAASLLTLRLSGEIMARKELEALQAVSSFFVHDLKNTTSTLSLMLANLPVHFADPVFRDDAIRGIRSTVSRLNQLIERAGSLRRKLDLDPVELDLNSLVLDSVDSLDSSTPNIRWVTKLDPLPKVRGDREQLQSVITNLLLNAREAIETTGAVTVETVRKEKWASLAVADNGCGMTSRFLKESLFRPFQTTKKKGLGIGMFQSKVIVEAHHGKISVRSEPGVGTTFSVLLPISAAKR
jgi:putative PEP-CTERM system histidine kinase